MIWATVSGSEELHDLGFATVDPERSMLQKLSDAFHFFNKSKGTTEFQLAYGNLPWWASEDATMQPFRPLAAFTHWIDFNVFERNGTLIHLHSLLYFVLFAFAGILFYSRLTQDKWVPIVAVLLLTFDGSSAIANFSWLAARNSYMAVAFGLLSIYCHIGWREQKGPLHGLFSLLFLGLAILSAEAGIATFGYLLSYALVADRSGWKKGLLYLLPAVLLILAWRGGYSASGFGASGIGLYLDPARDLGKFITQLFGIYPIIFLSQITGYDAFVSSVPVDWRIPVQVFAWIVFILLVALFKNVFRANRFALAMYLGALFAAIPHASLINVGSRSGTFVAIGFFFVFATWLLALFRDGATKKSRLLGSMILGYHILIPAIILSVVSFRLLDINYVSDQLYENSVSQMEENGASSLVIINPPIPAGVFYIPYRWAFNGFTVPDQIHALAPGLTTMSLKRETQNRFLLESSHGFVLNQNVEFSDRQGGQTPSSYHVHRMVQGLMTSPERQYRVGETIDRSGMLVTIASVNKGTPDKIVVEFYDENPDKKIWQYYDYEERVYKPFGQLAIGEQRLIKGPFQEPADRNPS